MTQKSRLSALILLGFLSGVASLPVFAASLPAPDGMAACKTDDAFRMALSRFAVKIGQLSGCFVSTIKVPVRNAHKTISLPLEYAYAVDVAPRLEGYSSQDLDSLYIKTHYQWQKLNTQWPQDKSGYEQRVNQLLQSTLPATGPHPTMKIRQPELVSMTRLDPDAYTVISVRQRNISVAGDSFTTTKVEGTGLVLVHDNLIRLSVVRELHSAADIKALDGILTQWIHAIEGKPSSP